MWLTERVPCPSTCDFTVVNVPIQQLNRISCLRSIHLLNQTNRILVVVSLSKQRKFVSKPQLLLALFLNVPSCIGFKLWQARSRLLNLQCEVNIQMCNSDYETPKKRISHNDIHSLYLIEALRHCFNADTSLYRKPITAWGRPISDPDLTWRNCTMLAKKLSVNVDHRLMLDWTNF